ncbi:MAG: NAD-dependent epimerase [Cytophagales bacterium]|nr:NAD-dependent epimerase [Cytophagales bacterium]
MKQKDSVLVTGAAGFIGFHLCRKLIKEGYAVVGVDSVNDYYDVTLKQARLSLIQGDPNFSFRQVNIADQPAINRVFEANSFNYVVNLAAQAGVRYSLENPHAYINANIIGFANILEGCRHYGIKHLLYASSSSVYGANTMMPFSVNQNVDHPISLYAATKKSNELMAHSYASNFGLSVSGLRFFTVYGPWGRPDMALFLFTKAILNDEPIEVFNNGKMQRDFTYIDDIVEGIYRLMINPATPNPDWNSDEPDPSTSFAPYRLYNIGGTSSVQLMSFIEAIEQSIGKKAVISFKPMQLGDVPATFADVSSLEEVTGFKPRTPLKQGVQNFVDWYRSYYKI